MQYFNLEKNILYFKLHYVNKAESWVYWAIP